MARKQRSVEEIIGELRGGRSVLGYASFVIPEFSYDLGKYECLD